MSSTFALSRHTQEEHLRLAPPRQGHWLGPVGLALVAHGLLVAALTWGVGWKQDAPSAVFEAELWSRLPVEAAPRAEEPPAPPPQPEPQPVVKAEPRPAPPPPGPSEAQIATQQAKKKKAEAEQRELEKQEARKKAATEKQAADKRALEQKKAAVKKANDEKQAQEEEALRKRNIERMMSQAGAMGSPTSAGTAKQASGQTAGYKQRLAALFKSNITFANPGSIPGNPKAVVEVSVGPTGSIISTKLSKTSGHPSWDEAVMRALDKTRKIPADEDGRYPPSFPVEFGPND